MARTRGDDGTAGATAGSATLTGHGDLDIAVGTIGSGEAEPAAASRDLG